MGLWSWTALLQCGCGGRGLAGVPEQVGVQQDTGGAFVDAWTLDDAEVAVGVQGDVVVKFEPRRSGLPGRRPCASGRGT